MIQIAVLGYGTVGSGVVEVINTNHSSINKKAGEEININMCLIFAISREIRSRKKSYMILMLF